MTTTTLGAPVEPLVCDRCNAAAQYHAALRAGPLLLCGHHYRRHATALRAAEAVTNPLYED